MYEFLSSLKKSVLLFIFIFFLTISISNAQNAILSGMIIDEETGLSMPGANVFIDQSRGTVSDRNGKFNFTNIKPGNYQLKISYIGYNEYSQNITLGENESKNITIKLTPTTIKKGDVIIIGEDLRGQAKALNQQKNRTNITNIISSDQTSVFPDANIGDALKRVTGVTVQYDQGEARYGLIRGTGSMLNSVTLNNDRIPSAEGETRSIQLDLIPSDMVHQLEVNKVLTPDMDADAIGGSINIVSRNIVNERRVSANIGGGIGFIRNKPVFNGNLILGERFLDNKLGIILSASYHSKDYGSDNIEGAWGYSNDIPYLTNFEVRTYNIKRIRQSISAGIDYNFDNQNSLFFNALYNHRNDWENRYRLRLRFDKGDNKGVPVNGEVKNVEIIRQDKAGIMNDKSDGQRLEIQKMYNFSIGGHHILFNLLDITWQGNKATAFEDKPNERYIAFRNKKATVKVDISNEKQPFFNIADGDVPEKLTLSELTEQNRYTDENDLNGRLDFSLPLLKEENRNNIKFGLRYRSKDKKRDNKFFNISTKSKFMDNMTLIETENFDNDKFLAGNYLAGSYPSRTFIGNLNFNDTSKFKITDAKEKYVPVNFDAKENILGSYLMLDQNLGSDLNFIAGLRIENTKIDYHAFKLFYDANNKTDPYKITPRQGDKSYTDLLPYFLMRYQFSDNLIIKAAWTNTLSRPNYYDLAPYKNIVVADNVVSEGNPNLEATKSMNFDLMLDYYWGSIGLVSGGLFYKNLKDYIYENITVNWVDPESQITYDNHFQPMNGSKANLLGFELSFQRHLDFLPGVLKGLSFYANYTYTQTEAEGLQIEGRENEKVTLPGTAPHMLNASLSYSYDNISLRLSVNYTADYIDQYGKDTRFDVYYDKQLFLDFNANYEITDQFLVYLDLGNITNQPLRYYQGKNQNNKTFMAEYYNLQLITGLKFNL